MARIQLTKNFYLDEFTRSQFAARYEITNTVIEGSDIHQNIQALCESQLQPMRNELGPIYISSGYRSPALNQKVGGAKKSAHMLGLAADIHVAGYSPLAAAQWSAENLNGYDQIINEFGQWVHISIPRHPNNAKNQTLTAIKHSGLFTRKKTHYIKGLHSQANALKSIRGQ